MPTLSPSERTAIMGEILGAISTAGYVYSLGTGSSSWGTIPPPRGTRLNCQAAARLAIQMAEERGVTGLKLVKTNIRDGFLVKAGPGQKAFGSNNPEIQTTRFSGWEFDNHYRVRDPIAGKTYDPTFGTSGTFNPTGIKCTSTSTQGLVMVSIYGEKYKVSRSTRFEVEELSTAAVSARYVVNDSNFN